jgi:hypothetical protein
VVIDARLANGLLIPDKLTMKASPAQVMKVFGSFVKKLKSRIVV